VPYVRHSVQAYKPERAVHGLLRGELQHRIQVLGKEGVKWAKKPI